MFHDKEYGKKCKIQYKPHSNLATLISEAYTRLKAGGIDPIFLEFVSPNINVRFNSKEYGYAKYFDPSDIQHISITSKGKTLQCFVDSAFDYYSQIKEKELFSSICDQEKGMVSISMWWSHSEDFLMFNIWRDEIKSGSSNFLECFKKHNGIIEKVIRLLGINDVVWREGKKKDDNGKEENYLIGEYKGRIGSSEKIFQTYQFLKKSELDSYSFNFTKYDALPFDLLNIHFSKNLYGSHVSIYGKSYDLYKKGMSGFENVLNKLDTITFHKVIYDTRKYKQKRALLDATKKLAEQLISDPNKFLFEICPSLYKYALSGEENEISRQIAALLEKEFYPILREGRTENEAKKCAVELAEFKLKFEISDIVDYGKNKTKELKSRP